jgi:hypothetical protein
MKEVTVIELRFEARAGRCRATGARRRVTLDRGSGRWATRTAFAFGACHETHALKRGETGVSVYREPSNDANGQTRDRLLIGGSQTLYATLLSRGLQTP